MKKNYYPHLHPLSEKSFVPEKLLSTRSITCVAAAAVMFTGVLVDTSRGQIVEYVWTGGDGDWGLASNWSPEGVPGQSGTPDTRTDRATIVGNVAVDFTGNIQFSNTVAGKGGSWDVLTLGGGSSLSVTGNFTTWSTSGTDGAARNIQVDAGSVLSVTGELRPGAPASTVRNSTWTIHGEVAGANFGGYKTTNDTSEVSIGGFILNIDGGTLTIDDVFNWNRNNRSNPNSVGQLNLSNAGTVEVGTMLPNWTSSTGNFVNFLDGTGSLSLGYTNWETQSAIQGLIDSGFIRTDMNGGIFEIFDTGSGWTVSVIPEPSTYAFLASLFAGLFVILLRRRN